MHELAYIPTVFPGVHNPKPPKTLRAVKLAERNLMGGGSSSPHHLEYREEDIDVRLQQLEMKTVSIQTEPFAEIETTTPSFMYCAREQQDVSIQTEIHTVPPSQTKIIVVDQPVKETQDMSCGPDEVYNPGFTGFPDIETDTSMRQLAGVTRTFFLMLLKSIDKQRVDDDNPTVYRKLGKEN
ncbi:uncharacterized protein LOC107042757 [Diachasma alloeum]|uniref:uncharacterized protein LOC107042757 n=1 Tax=Diachasma alloeum TaxID=454923 RepID=UPI0007382855|nr:uncharacterized protein LOC107042757 [Diachasma alloeum]